MLGRQGFVMGEKSEGKGSVRVPWKGHEELFQTEMPENIEGDF